MIDVLVIGAGPAGSVTATLLARKGIQVTLVDKARFPRDKPCAEYLSPGVLAMLDRLRLGSALPPEGALPLRGFRLFDDGIMVGATFRGSEYAIAASRRDFDASLVRTAVAAGATVEEGVRVLDIEPGDDFVRVAAEQSGGKHVSITARLVIAADGVNSVIAHRLQVRRPHPTLRRIGLVAHVRGIAGLGDHGEMHVGDGYYCGLAPFDRNTVNAAMVISQDDIQSRHGDTDTLFLERLRRLPSLRERVDGARLATPVALVGPLACTCTSPAMQGVFFVGDAGGFYDPFTGQGIYRALRGAELVSELVTAGLTSGDPKGATRRYRYLRRRAFIGGWTLERVVQRVVATPGLRRRVFHRLQDHPELADRLIRVTGDIAPTRSVINPWYIGRLLA